MSKIALILFCLSAGFISLFGVPKHSTKQPSSLLFTQSTILGPVHYHEGASESEKDAAHDLARVLSKISGHNWPIESTPSSSIGYGIYVGQAAHISDSFEGAVELIEQRQSFRVIIQPNRIYLIGSTAESVVFAVYYFLNQYLSARWFIPGEIGEELPKFSRKRLKLMKKIVAPSFFSRNMIAGQTDSERKEWGQRNLLSKQWNFSHNLHRIVTPDLFETKPDWFSLHGDKRVPTKGGRGLNPNLANLEVARFVSSEAIQYFTENPDSETFSISVTDNVRFDNSRETLEIVTPFEYFRNRPNYSDLVFGFSNSVAEEIWPLDSERQIEFHEVSEPAIDKYLGALAYYWAEQIPSFPVHPRVIPYLTSDRGQWFSDAYREEDKMLIEAWCSAGPEIIGTWDYYEGGPYFIPRGFMRSVRESIPFLHRAGVRAFFAEGTPQWGFDGPRLWLASQLLWDAEQDTQSLIDEFFRDYYKESAKPMRSFFDICERVWYNQAEPAVWLKFYLMPSQAELFPLNVWEELEAKLVEAQAMAETEQIKARVALVQEELNYGATMSKAYFAWKSAYHNASPESRTALEVARDKLRQLTLPNNRLSLEMFNIMLEVTEPSEEEVSLSGKSRYLLSESFSEALVDGDSGGVGPLPFVGAKLRDGWSSSSFHNQNFNFSRIPLLYPRGNMAARIIGSTFFNLFDWLPVEQGQYLSAQMRFRGKISPGSRIKISLRWMDGEGTILATDKFADIPVGDYTEWRMLTEGAISPPNAEWALFSLSIQEQMPGDFLEIDTIEVLESTMSEN